MDWDQVNRTARLFVKDLLGSGYVPEYYQQFADELTASVKACEVADPTPEQVTRLRAQLDDATQSVTITKLGDSSVYVGMTRAEALSLHAQLTRELKLT